MKRCIVIGGGIAGLTSAAYLTKQNIKVTLLESSPKLAAELTLLPSRNLTMLLIMVSTY